MLSRQLFTTFLNFFVVQFIYSEMVTKNDEISKLYLKIATELQIGIDLIVD